MTKWYSIQAKTSAPDLALPPEVEVRIYKPIGSGGVTADDFLNELQAKAPPGTRLTVALNCIGGAVIEGFAIYNALRRYAGVFKVRIDGLAASMASYIACAADEVVIAANGRFMIHNPSVRLPQGDAETLRTLADQLDQTRDLLADGYKRKTGNKTSRETILRLMAAETWLSAKEAVAMGFVDRIDEPVRLYACAGLQEASADFKNAPADFLAELQEAPEQAPEQAADEGAQSASDSSYTGNSDPSTDDKAMLSILAQSLSLAADASLEDVQAAVAALQEAAQAASADNIAAQVAAAVEAAVATDFVAKADLLAMATANATLEAELVTLKAQTLADKVAARVETAMAAGQLPPAMKGFATKTGLRSFEDLEDLLSNLPATSALGQESHAAAKPLTDPLETAVLDLDAVDQAVCKQLGLDPAKYKATKAQFAA